MTKSQTFEIVAARPVESGVILTLKGEDVNFDISLRKSWDNIVKTYPMINEYTAPMLLNVTGEVEFVPKGHETVLDAEHPLVKDGCGGDVTVKRGNKSVVVLKGDKCLVGDIHIAPQDKYRFSRKGSVAIGFNEAAKTRIMNRLIEAMFTNPNDTAIQARMQAVRQDVVLSQLEQEYAAF